MSPITIIVFCYFCNDSKNKLLISLMVHAHQLNSFLDGPNQIVFSRFLDGQCASNNMIFFICIVHQAMIFSMVFQCQQTPTQKLSFLDGQNCQDNHCIKKIFFLMVFCHVHQEIKICVPRKAKFVIVAFSWSKCS